MKKWQIRAKSGKLRQLRQIKEIKTNYGQIVHANLWWAKLFWPWSIPGPEVTDNKKE